MDKWFSGVYGDPCRECAFEFSSSFTDLDGALAIIRVSHALFAGLLENAAGTERLPDLSWNVGAYTFHVADNLRVWAERLVASAAGSPSVVPYEENELAQARGYNELPLVSALWSLERGAGDWELALAGADRGGVVLVHPERGEMTLADVASAVGHETYHHAWDIRRTLAAVR